MNIALLCRELTHQSQAIMALTAGIDEAAAKQRPQVEEWSLLEVMCHLYDEEREDFRVRVIQTLTAPHQPLPSIDPEGWVQSRQYAQQSFLDMRQRFAAERHTSIQQLQLLQQYPTLDWQTPLNHPRLSPLTAEQVAWAWIAHDLLHIRQITALRYQHFGRQTDAYGYGYAGEWHTS